MEEHSGTQPSKYVLDAVANGAELPEAGPPSVVEVPPGGSLDIRVISVAKRIGEDTVPMLAYNGSIPGPTLRVRQGSEILVNVTNDTQMDTTIHWHGLRLENRYDGVPHETQAPIPPGGRYTHRLTFPDAGLYWYHPHIREDFTQELGRYGNVIVEPADPSYWPPADREITLTLDDILIEGGKVAAFDELGPNYTAMGRFGNVMLIGGEVEQHLEARRGEVVRFHFTNTANTRVFKVTVPGARMKLVGGDSGRYECEEWVDDVVIAPSERTIVDMLFDEPGTFDLQHVTPERAYRLATISVADPQVQPSRRDEFVREALGAAGQDDEPQPPARYFTYASVLASLLAYGDVPVPTVVLGPGEPEQCHVVDEWCSASAVETSGEVYSALLDRWCSRA